MNKVYMIAMALALSGCGLMEQRPSEPGWPDEPRQTQREPQPLQQQAAPGPSLFDPYALQQTQMQSVQMLNMMGNGGQQQRRVDFQCLQDCSPRYGAQYCQSKCSY